MLDVLQVEEEILKDVVELMLRLGIFSVLAAISPFMGRVLPRFLQWIFKLVERRIEGDFENIYDRFVRPFQNSLIAIGTSTFLAICLNLLIQYKELYTFLGFIIYSGLSIGIVWFASKITRQLIRQSAIILVRRWFGQVNEIVLVFETLIYVLIILSAIVIFAVGLRVDPIALATSLGIGSVAIGLGAQQTLGRLFGTMELYLDRPYVPGEYIRVTFNPFLGDVYGRVESIGLRSTKIRIVAQNTMIVVPNSTMASLHIENISRGKKIMAMLCLDFIRLLKEGEQALVSRIVEEASQLFWGFDRASTRIQFGLSENTQGTRARVIFFISSSGENSLELRKRLLELANEEFADKLAAYNLQFKMPEPVVYVDSPMSI